MVERQRYWHAVFTASRAEKKVRERFEEEGVECFLPVQTVVRQWTHRKARVVVPVIAGMIFVRVEKREQITVLETRGVVSFLRLRGEKEPAVIPDKQMADFRFLLDFSEEAVEMVNEEIAVGFRFLLDFSEEAVEMVNEEIAVGDMIQVVKGPLKGLEGELVKFRGTTKVAVRIDMLGCALVDIPASFVEKRNP